MNFQEIQMNENVPKDYYKQFNYAYYLQRSGKIARNYSEFEYYSDFHNDHGFPCGEEPPRRTTREDYDLDMEVEAYKKTRGYSEQLEDFLHRFGYDKISSIYEKCYITLMPPTEEAIKIYDDALEFMKKSQDEEFEKYLRDRFPYGTKMCDDYRFYYYSINKKAKSARSVNYDYEEQYEEQDPGSIVDYYDHEDYIERDYEEPTEIRTPEDIELDEQVEIFRQSTDYKEMLDKFNIKFCYDKAGGIEFALLECSLEGKDPSDIINKRDEALEATKLSQSEDFEEYLENRFPDGDRDSKIGLLEYRFYNYTNNCTIRKTKSARSAY